jgi:hypothetical protein
MELKSLTKRSKSVESESGSLRMFRESLVYSSMRLGAVRGQTCLLSGGALDSPVHHRTVTVAVRCVISFHIWRIRPLVLGVSWRTRHCPVHTGQSGVPNRPLLQATRRPRIAQPTVGAGDLWLTRQSGAPSDSPVNYSCMLLHFPRAASSPPASMAHRTLSGVPGQSWCWLKLCQLFSFSSLLLLALFLAL